MNEARTLIETRDLVQHFAQGRFLGRSVVHALNGVSLTVREGETLGLVGETGCGKSTLARAVMRLYNPTGGQVLFDGVDVTRLPERKLKFLRRSMQIVFQDPADSMNPRLPVGYIVEEPLIIQTRMMDRERRDRVAELLTDVGLDPSASMRYPHEFSGGQRQRIAIARALALKPRVIVCDEPVSALDVSVQSQVLNLLLSLQKEHGLTLLFISHALGVVRHMSDRVAVMYLGTVAELADSKAIYESPRHPYTKALIAAIPSTDPTARKDRRQYSGEVPSPLVKPVGCPFKSNCPIKVARCEAEKPELRELAPGHQVACHLA